jgi:hypothetical protein
MKDPLYWIDFTPCLGREKKKEKHVGARQTNDSYLRYTYLVDQVHSNSLDYFQTCVCVREIERERERKRVREVTLTHIHIKMRQRVNQFEIETPQFFSQHLPKLFLQQILIWTKFNNLALFLANLTICQGWADEFEQHTLQNIFLVPTIIQI